MTLGGAGVPTVTISDQTRTSIEFRLINVSRHFANALRRVMIAEIETLAIETVEFMQNSSTLPDEYIAHRLGLIPFNSEGCDKFNYFHQCQCGKEMGCPKCRIVYTLNVTCSAGESNGRTVTSNDLELVSPSVYGDNGFEWERLHQEAKPVSLFSQKIDGEPEPIAIAKLGPGQQLKFIAYVQKGIGRVHSKWSPVSVSAFHQIAVVNFRESTVSNMSPQEKQDIVDSCPENLYSMGPDGNIKINDEHEKCTFCNQCIRKSEMNGKKDAIIIQSKRGIFVFNVETVGSLSPESVVSRGFRVLSEKLKIFLQNVEKCNP